MFIRIEASAPTKLWFVFTDNQIQRQSSAASRPSRQLRFGWQSFFQARKVVFAAIA
jgi:hypothetical protein